MTCVVALIENGVAYMGSDSQGSGEWDKQIRQSPKCFRVGEFLIGYSGSYRMGQIVQYNFAPPKILPLDAKDLHKYMVVKFIPALRAVLDQNDYKEKKLKHDFAVCLIVTVRGRVFNIESDWQVGDPVTNYSATGSGYDHAMGALHALSGSKIKPETKIIKALEAAETFGLFVGRPFNVISDKEAE